MSYVPFPIRARFTHRSWGVLLFAVALVTLSAATLAYRLTLPTDGWAIRSTNDWEHADWVYIENLVGASSALQRDDVLHAVNGQSVVGAADRGYVVPPPGWAAGQRVDMRVVRQGLHVSLQVPVVHWTLPAVWHLLVTPDVLFGLVSGALLFAVALFTFYRRSDMPAAALLVMSAAWLTLNMSGALPDGLSVQFNQLAAYTTALFSYLLFIVVLAPALLAFTLLFPQPKRVIQRHPWLGFVPFAAGVLVGAFAWTGQAAELGYFGTQALVAGALASLIHAGVTQRDAVSRAQLRWAGGGLVVGMTCMLLFFLVITGWVADSLAAHLISFGFHVGFTIIGVALAVAILRYRLFDIDLIIHRALVYATLTVGVVGIYVLVVGYLGMLFRREGNLVFSLIATGIVAVAFAPLRTVVQRGVNRLMYGERDEPYRVLTRLGQQLETALEPSQALPQTAETVARALKLPYAAIMLKHNDGWETVAAYGTVPNDVTQFPLIYAGTCIGELVVAARAPHEAWTSADQRLLHDLARQIAVAAHAVALRTDLEHARLRIVTERGEARRRLGSDLHDGVGHQLTAMTRQIEQAIRALAHDPTVAHHVLADINRQLVAVTTQVRDLAHQLFPPELELLGLAGALRERAQTYPDFTILVDAPSTVPPLPAEIETAAYYIALEALTNVHKHAQARTCQIRLGLRAGHASPHTTVLQLDIIDDGQGFSGSTSTGLGLRSMQARAAEVGGTCPLRRMHRAAPPSLCGYRAQSAQKEHNRMDSIRVVIADDQVITRSGLRTLLAAQANIEVVGEAHNGEEAIQLATSLQPDVILMDLRMPGINGIEATRQIHRTSPHISILVLTVFEDDTSVFPAIRAGARGYLLKNTEQDELLRAIHTVVHGGAIFSPGIAQKVLRYLSAPHPMCLPRSSMN